MQKVLIVDDEKKSRDFISDLIVSFMPNTEITHAKYPHAALGMVENNDYDMVFTDIRMPQMSGIEMIREIKKKGKKPFVVMISAYDKFEYAQEAMECGASGYLLKPFNRERVEHILNIYKEKCNPFSEDVMLLNRSAGDFPVKISEIVALEKTDKSLFVVYGTTFAKMQVRGTLAGIAGRLSGNFIYVNRQCIIDIHAIQSFNLKSKEVFLSSPSGELSFVCSRGNIKKVAALFKKSLVVNEK